MLATGLVQSHALRRNDRERILLERSKPTLPQQIDGPAGFHGTVA
jgi:hypothetical protein